MSARSAIKWRESDKAKIAKTVRKFNAKRTRLIKQVPELEEYLPNKMNVNELKKSIYSRNDFNKTINKLERFMIKGAEDMVTTEGGVQTTKYQLKELKIQQRTINQYRASQRKTANVSTERGTMGSIREMNLRPLTKNIEQTTKEMWDNLVKNYEKKSMDKYYTERDEEYKENYLKGFSKYFQPIAPDEYKIIKNMKASDVIEMYYYDPNLQLKFVYPVEGEPVEPYVGFFKDTFYEYLESKNIDYKKLLEMG